MGLETIREGVALETREHGPATGAETLVVWGHGLCNSMGGEDVERLWDFWRCPDGDPSPKPRAWAVPRAGPRFVFARLLAGRVHVGGAGRRYAGAGAAEARRDAFEG